ncbi:unnamed protein product [Brassica oleracea]|uniref:(rape) hypothetical protein n=1 Tax=Brassica napus TaxID=3708 RepID=A0A816IQD1_BRANA|nr:unnamed protein product [Brassica napus]
MVTIRKNVTERMYSALKNEIKQREAMWGTVYGEMVEVVIKIKTLQARLRSVEAYPEGWPPILDLPSRPLSTTNQTTRL